MLIRFATVNPIFRDDGTNVYVTLRRERRREPARAIVEFIERHGAIDNRQALDLLAMDSSEQVTNLFSKLRDQGIIARENVLDTGVRVKWRLGQNETHTNASMSAAFIETLQELSKR